MPRSFNIVKKFVHYKGFPNDASSMTKLDSILSRPYEAASLAAGSVRSSSWDIARIDKKTNKG